MKQGSNNRRSRSRGGGGGKRHSGGGGRNSFESNGPDVKIRGTAQQVQEKYLSLARDAISSGDWVSAEAYYQFAEHYYRVINSDVQKQNQNKDHGQSQGQGQNKGPVDRNVRNQHSPVAAQEKPAPQADQKPEPKPEPKPDSKGDAADASAATPIAAEEKPASQADRKPAPKPAPKSGPKPVSKGNAAGASPATLAAAVAERESAESKNASEPKPDPVPEKAAS